MTIDHIVISVKNLKISIKFYTVFLGKPKVNTWDASWRFGSTQLFLTSPYKNKPQKFDKHNLGLNHFAFGVQSIPELKRLAARLDKAKIKHSGIISDQYNTKNQLIWFDDPDGIRLEFYYRKR